MAEKTIPGEYGALVCGACGIIGMVQLFLGSQVMKERKRIFESSTSFSKKKEVIAMNEEHKKAFGSPMNNLGYPDMGNGRYSAQLSYEDWVKFNNIQRCHYNMVESSGTVLAAMIVGGFFNPRLCSALGVAYAFGMICFFVGYNSKKGANGRIFGAAIRSIATVGLFLVCLYQASGILFQVIFESLVESIRVMEDED